MSTTDGQRVGGLRTEIFYIVVIVTVSLIVAFFVGVSYQHTTTMIVEANKQTNIALGVIATHGPSANTEIKGKNTVDISSSTTGTSSAQDIKSASTATPDLTAGVNVEIAQ